MLGAQDGRSSSLTAPNGPSQTALIGSVVKAAGAPHCCVTVPHVSLLQCACSPRGDTPWSWLMAHVLAGMQPGELGLVAIHGTGTPLGDPIEVGALGAALPAPAQNGACSVTVASVKSCYGHTEGCAGLTGALLAMQALRHRVSAATLQQLQGVRDPRSQQPG